MTGNSGFKIAGAIVGAVAGFVAGGVMGVYYVSIITGPAGAILGGIAGYRVAGGDFGCTGGCLAVIAIWVFLILSVVLAA